MMDKRYLLSFYYFLYFCLTLHLSGAVECIFQLFKSKISISNFNEGIESIFVCLTKFKCKSYRC